MIDDGVLAERQWRNDDVVVVFRTSRSFALYKNILLSFFFSFFLSIFLSFFLLTHGKNPFHIKYH